MRNFLKLVLAIAVCRVVGIAGAFFTSYLVRKNNGIIWMIINKQYVALS